MSDWGWVNEVHGVLLEMGTLFHKICVKHSIPYYMLGGTMLGAIRHKDIIPWDDDMDFGVPRKYWQMLHNVLNAELPDRYEVLTYKNADINTDIIKINLKGSKLIYHGESQDWGINIDLFPLDYADTNVGFFSANRLIWSLIMYNEIVHSNVRFRKKTVNLSCWLLRKINFIGKEPVIRFIEKHSYLKQNDYTALANHYGIWGCKEVVPKDVMGTPKLYKFNKYEFYGVENYDNYLKSLYGNYMQIPSPENRHIHFDQVILP